MVWEDRYERQCGFWRPYIQDVIYRYLDCGDLRNDFARVKCADCSHEYLLPTPFHVNAGTSVRHVIRKESSFLEKSYVKMC